MQEAIEGEAVQVGGSIHIALKKTDADRRGILPGTKAYVTNDSPAGRCDYAGIDPVCRSMLYAFCHEGLDHLIGVKYRLDTKVYPAISTYEYDKLLVDIARREKLRPLVDAADAAEARRLEVAKPPAPPEPIPTLAELALQREERALSELRWTNKRGIITVPELELRRQIKEQEAAVEKLRAAARKKGGA